MIKWLIYLLLGIAALFAAVGLVLLFTVFWIFIGLPLIVIGLIIALIVWLSLPKKNRQLVRVLLN